MAQAGLSLSGGRESCALRSWEMCKERKSARSTSDTHDLMAREEAAGLGLRHMAANVDRAQVFPLAGDSPFARAQARDREVLNLLAALRTDFEVTPWLQESGFHVYLAGADKAAVLRQTEAPVRPSPDADGWIRGLHTLFEAAKHALTEIHGGRIRISRPFRVVAQQDTIRRYAEEWARALCFVVRHVHGVWQADLAAASPRVAVMPTQQQCVDEAIRVAMTGGSRQPEMRRAVHALSLALIQQPLPKSRFESALMCFAAARAVTSGGALQEPQQYTPFLSRMIYCGQLWLFAESLALRAGRPDNEEPLVSLAVPPSHVSWDPESRVVAFRDKRLAMVERRLSDLASQRYVIFYFSSDHCGRAGGSGDGGKAADSPKADFGFEWDTVESRLPRLTLWNGPTSV
ncbi:MAG: hypothetical protein M1826_006736 [Phylliscum demangeonii]|nr:MAG: hypothetical protein M1826_006736 [Phylliscum demangeonii]